VARPAPAPEDRVKRLTLDLPADVHRALKIRSAELEVPMVELLRRLIGQALKEPSTSRQKAQRRRDAPKR
jgi:hypothetical protein